MWNFKPFILETLICERSHGQWLALDVFANNESIFFAVFAAPRPLCGMNPTGERRAIWESVFVTWLFHAAWLSGGSSIGTPCISAVFKVLIRNSIKLLIPYFEWLRILKMLTDISLDVVQSWRSVLTAPLGFIELLLHGGENGICTNRGPLGLKSHCSLCECF